MAFSSSLLSKASEFQTMKNQSLSNSNPYSISLMRMSVETEPVIEIDSDTRKITIPEELFNIGVTGDHRCETIYFQISRYFDDIDLSTHDCIIRFVNAGNEYGEENVCDVEVSNTHIKFGWSIDKRVTRYSGKVEFTVQFETIDQYQWQTIPAQLNILAGLNIEKTITEKDDVLFRTLTNQISEIKDRLNSIQISSDKIESLSNKLEKLEKEVDYLKNNVVYILNE